MQAMYDLVGDRLRDLFDAQVLDIGILDREDGLLHFPYTIERGVRFPDEPIELFGIRQHVMATREPLLVNERAVEVDIEMGGKGVLSGEPALSTLWAPLVVAGDSTGVISLQNLDREFAFTEADIRLLTTLASSLSVSLENARLIDTTKRLLTEADERAAELAIINGVQQGLAAQIDMQAMYDLVGDKLREVFDAQVVDIGILDPDEGRFHFPYTIERGVRYDDRPLDVIGFRRQVVETRAPVLVNRDLQDRAAEAGQPAVIQGELSKSALFVPMVSRGEVRGVLLLANNDREEAFTDADVRLLTTLAGSLAVALENARLIDTTKRLLAETDERAAELAIINGVQQGLAAQIDMQAMYDLVGDKLREVFDAQVVDIAVIDREADTVRFPFLIERGVRFPEEVIPLVGFRRHIAETRQPLLINERMAERREEFGQSGIQMQGELPKAGLWVPLILRNEAFGIISLQNLDHEGAFSDADVRLLSTLAGSLSVALENARLFDETKRLLAEADERAAELEIINGVQEGLAARIDMQAMYDLVGEKLLGVFKADVVGIAVLDREAQRFRFPYAIERGVRVA